jgi:hypothetical protein
MLETLTCNAGHNFSRERVRGRKPVWCPEHRPVIATSKPVVDNDQPVMKPAVHAPMLDKDVSRAIYHSQRVSNETKNKLRYAERQIENPLREQADINLMVQVRKNAIAVAHRQMQQAGVRVDDDVLESVA